MRSPGLSDVRPILRIGLTVATGSLLVSCQQTPAARGSSATLAETCADLASQTENPPDPQGPPAENGPPPGNPNNEVELFRTLAHADVRERANAAMKLLRHPHRRAPAVLEAAIRVSGTLGDFRILNNLRWIMLQKSGDPQEPEATYPLSARVAAAAAAGRILEQDREASPGDDTGGDGGLDAEGKAQTILVLKLSACPAEPTELRSAAIEALGIARNESASEFLELISSEPQAPDDSRRLLLQALADRSLTNIKHNNHLVDSGVDEQLRELTAAMQEPQEVGP